MTILKNETKIKQIKQDIKFLSQILNLTKPRSSRFGQFVNFEYHGPFLTYKREGNHGFFYGFQKSGIFTHGSHPDLHLSIIDRTGFAIPHLTFKPDGENGVAYHYGIKNPGDNFQTPWITNQHLTRFNAEHEKVIMKHLESGYKTIVQPNLVVLRKDASGNLVKPPYNFPEHGTVGRVKTTPQRRYAERAKASSTAPVRTPLKPVNKTAKKRLSEHFEKR
jgi:hypothetical protein